MPEKPRAATILKLVDSAFDRHPVDTIRRGLRGAFKIACESGDASSASFAKTLLELETSRHESNEAQAPILKKNSHYCPSCGQKLMLQDAAQAISFKLCFGGDEPSAEESAPEAEPLQ